MIGYLLAVVVLAAGLTVGGLITTSPRPADWVTWGVLVACALLCVQVSRRVGEPAGVANDLLSAWTLPIALLLPPVFALLAPMPLTAVKQLQVRRGLLHRRVFSASAIGLANWTASIVFHHLMPPSGASNRAAAQMVLAAIACGVLGWAVNVALIATAARLTSPELSWRSLLWNSEQGVLDAGEVCLGVVVFGCWTVTPVLALVMLVPVLLVQRGLTTAQLRAAARTDPKTGLLNAGAWQQEAEREIVRAGRTRQPLAVLLADLDHFKGINDAHGHMVGDQVLKAAAHALAAGLREYDILGRFGGEEFTMLLPNTDHREACRVAERVRWHLVAAPVVVNDLVIDVTVSIGVAAFGPHGRDLTDLLTAADLALYRAKNNGRNQVALAAGTAEDPSAP